MVVGFSRWGVGPGLGFVVWDLGFLVPGFRVSVGYGLKRLEFMDLGA